MHTVHLKQHVIIVSMLLVLGTLDFKARANSQDEVDTGQGAHVTSVPQVVMPPIRTGSSHKNTLSKKDKAMNDKLSTDKQKRGNVKTRSVKAKMSAEKKKEAATVEFLKANQECDSWFELDGNTSDEKAYQQIKNTGYTKENAPLAVKNQIAEGVAKCNQKYLISNPTNQSKSEIINPKQDEISSGDNESQNHQVGFFEKVSNGVSKLFGQFKKGNNGSKHTCSPVEVLMHSNEC